MNKNELRLKLFLQNEGYEPDIYLEMFNYIEEHNYDLNYFSGENFRIADDLARWGFLKKIISPIISRDGNYIGNNIYFASLNVKLVVDKEINKNLF